MSTHDSYLLCWASVLTHDVVAPATNERLTTRWRLALSRVFILVIGLFLLVWGLWYDLGQDLWDYMAVSGAIYFTGAFTLLLPDCTGSGRVPWGPTWHSSRASAPWRAWDP